MPENKQEKVSPPFYDLISPKQAAAWLSKNPYNRPLKESLVAEYARKMEAGEWKEKGGIPIWVTEDGELINGQHRLAAVVRFGRPVLLKVQVREKPAVSWKEWHNRQKNKKNNRSNIMKDLIDFANDKQKALTILFDCTKDDVLAWTGCDSLKSSRCVNPSFEDVNIKFSDDGKLRYEGIEVEFVQTFTDGHDVLRVYQSGSSLDESKILHPVVKRIAGYGENGPVSIDYGGNGLPEGLEYAVIYDGEITAGKIGNFYDTGDDSVSKTTALGNKKTNEEILGFALKLIDELKNEIQEAEKKRKEHGFYNEDIFGKIYIKSEVSDEEAEKFIDDIQGYYYNNWTIKKRLPDENGFKVFEVSPDLNEMMANNHPEDQEIATYNTFCDICEDAANTSAIPFFGLFCMPTSWDWDDYIEEFCIGAWYEGEACYTTKIKTRDELGKVDEVLKKIIKKVSASKKKSSAASKDFRIVKGELKAYRNKEIVNLVIPHSVTEIAEGAFRDCKLFESVEFGGTMAQWESVKGKELNLLCYIPAKVVRCSDGEWQKPVVFVEAGHAVECLDKSLTRVVIPENVTKIDDWAFSGCKSLTSVVIPKGVTSIGMRAFLDCELLASLEFSGTMAQWKSVYKQKCWIRGCPVTVVHCSDGEASLE